MSTIAKLLLLLTLMPILEISILVPLHSLVGDWWTVGIVIFTATLGTFLIKWQGGLALKRIKETMAEGKLPGDEIIDGVLILLSSVTLITPGVVTDTIGLFLLVPTFRAPVRRYVKKRISNWIDEKTQPVGFGFSSPRPGAEERAPRAFEGATESEGQEAWQEAAVEEPAHLGQPDEIF